MLGRPLRVKTMAFRNTVAKYVAIVVRNPNILTYSSVLFAVLFAITHILGKYLLAFLLLILAYGVDAIDGSVARLVEKTSKWGNYLDAMMDKYVEGIVYIALGTWFPFAALLAAIFTFIESYAKPRTALVVPIDNHDWPAMGERVERGLLLILGYLAFLFTENQAIIMYTLYLVAVITLIGSIQRMLYAKGLIEGKRSC